MGRLFPQELATKTWAEFEADGFSRPVSGMLLGAEDARCGVPLGGIGTGCVDFNPNGTLGRCSLFNSVAPPRELHVPLIAIRISGKDYSVSSIPMPNFTRPAEMKYWGHYPIADLECELNQEFSLGMRTWSPFMLGNAEGSNTPVCFFEVRLRNAASTAASVSLVLSFPGPSPEESKGQPLREQFARGTVRGIQVSSINASYVLASTSKYPVRTGAPLFHGGTIANLATASQSETGASIATDLEIAPGEEADLHFVLAWYAPRWAGSSTHHYVHAYARRFRSVGEVAEMALERRGEWLSRILDWQQAVFSEADLPPWLRDQLVNVLHTIAKDSFWAADSIPKELWYGNVGLFALTESPRTTPHVCNPSDWYGNLPIVYFFPDLMLSLLRSYVHFQLPTGEVPLGIGEGSDLCRPTYQVLRVMNSCVHIHLIDRSWQRDGDAGVLTEFYRSARAALGYMRSLDRDDDGLPELDSDPAPEQFYGAWPWLGVSPYVAGFWITAVQMMGRMSSAIGDRATQEMCADWEKKARETLERQLWNGRCYLLFADPGSKKGSDTVLANQLVGQWCAQLHGLPPLVGTSRAQAVLSRVADACSASTNAGLMNAMRPDGSLDHSGSPHSDGIFTAECLCTTATMMYEGLGKEGSEYARRLMQTVVVADGVGWELPNILNEDGSVRHGDDFYQLMILWALPLAMNKESLAKSCSEGFVHRVLNAGRTD